MSDKLTQINRETLTQPSDSHAEIAFVGQIVYKSEVQHCIAFNFCNETPLLCVLCDAALFSVHRTDATSLLLLCGYLVFL